MFSIAIIFTVIILGYYYYEVTKRKKYESNRSNEVGRFSRSKETIRFHDAFILFCFLVLAYKGHEYMYVYIPLFTSRIIEMIKLNDEIVLFEDGLAFNKTFIKWFEIESISNKNKNTIVVSSRGLKGKFYIENIDNAEALKLEIENLHSWSSS